MARRRTGGTLLPWLSAHVEGKEGRFLQIGNSLLLSKSFQELTSGAQILYLCMALESGGKPTVAFSRSTAAKYGISKNPFARQVSELAAAGFIEVDRDGSYEQFKATIYRFTYSWKTKVPSQK